MLKTYFYDSPTRHVSGITSCSMTPQLWRAIAIAALMATVAPTVSAQVVYLAPPPVEYVPPPPSPPAWHTGYWSWEYGRYVWRAAEPVAVAPPVYAAPERESRGPQVERLSSDALFRFDRGDAGDITPEGIADLEQIVARLRRSHFDRVEIRGYTDRLGSERYNLDLSQHRADAVKALMVQEGIPANKIQSEGLGEQNPVVQCDEPDGPSAIRCLQPNRRVEIVTYINQSGYAEGDTYDRSSTPAYDEGNPYDGSNVPAYSDPRPDGPNQAPPGDGY